MNMFQSQLTITRWHKVLLGIALAFILFVNYSLPVFAQQIQQPTPSKQPPQKTRSLLDWLNPSNWLMPQRRARAGLPSTKAEVAGRRGRCPAIATDIGEIPLKALLPRTSGLVEAHWDPESIQDAVWGGRTVAAYPTFWFYLPYHQQDDLKFAKFVLLDENKKVVVGPILLQLPDAAAVAERPVLAKFTLPKSVQPLAADQTYNWFFSIVCDARKPSKNPSVSGWIERVKPPYPIALYQGLPTANDYLYYAQAGLWYDTVTRIADSRMQSLQPQIKPAAPDIGKTQPAASASLEDDWLGLFQFLFQSPGLSDEQLKKMANQVANAQIVDLVPVAIAQPTGRVAQP